MKTAEGILLWASLFSYLGAFALFLVGILFSHQRVGRWAWGVAWAGFAAESGAMAVRWVATGHPPVQGEFESALAGSWALVLVYLAGSAWFRWVRPVGVVLIPGLLLMIGLTLGGPSTAHAPLAPPYQSNWLWIHVGFAWIAFGGFATAAGLGVAYLLLERSRRQGRPSRLDAWFPDLQRIDDLMLRFVAFGFIGQGLMIAAGSIWASDLWGSYWSWDPVETWSLVTWLVYGVFLHLRLVMRWKGRRNAWFMVGALVVGIISIWGIGFASQFHTPLL